MTTTCLKCAKLPIFRIELEKLDRFRQRATYEAFGGALRTNKRSPLQDHTHDALHSWVVAKANGLPSGYDSSEQHPELGARESIISDEGRTPRLARQPVLTIRVW